MSETSTTEALPTVNAAEPVGVPGVVREDSPPVTGPPVSATEVVRELFFALQELEQLRASGSRSRVHLVTVTDDGEAFWTECPSVEHAAEAIRAMVSSGANAKVYVFQGERLQITKGPLRYLLSSSGHRLPLFENDRAGEIDPTGEIGSEPVAGLQP